MKVTILHLSDLHLSVRDKEEERSKILNPLVRDIANRFVKLKLSSPYIALTGDLANFGLKSEFELVGEFVSKLESALTIAGFKPLGIMLCPGNHDVNRKTRILPANKQLMEDLVKRKANNLDEEKKVLERVDEWLADGAGRTALRKRMKDYYEFAKSYHKLNKNDNFLHYTKSYIDEKLTINFVSINSAYLFSEDIDSPDQIGGFIGNLQIQQALASLPKESADSRTFNIALVHYPFEEIIKTGRENDEARLNGWADLVLTSHRHKSLIRLIEDIHEDETKQRKKSPLVICRSKCIFAPDKTPGAVAGYHIIDMTFNAGELSDFNIWGINYQPPTGQNNEAEWIEDQENYPKKVPLNFGKPKEDNKEINVINLEEFKKLTDSQKNREIARINICTQKNSSFGQKTVCQKYFPSLYVERQESAIIDEFLTNEKRIIAFVGPVGMGKTNFMCHTAGSLSQTNFVMFYSGANLAGNLKETILADLKNITGDLNFDNALEMLSKALEIKRQQLLIFVDGLNEITRNREAVRIQLNEIAHLIQQYPICLIASCRDMDWDYWLRSNSKIKGSLGESIFNKPIGSSMRAISINKFSDEEFSVAWRIYKQFYSIEGALGSHIAELCKEPFMLRILAETYRESKEIPDFLEPIDLFQRYFEENFISRGLTEEVWLFFSWLTQYLLTTELPYLPYSEVKAEYRSICDLIIDKNILYIDDNLLKFHFEQILEYIISRNILTNSQILGTLDNNKIIKILLKNNLVNVPGVLENIVLSNKADNIALVESLKELLKNKERGQMVCCRVIAKLFNPPIEIGEIALELAGDDSEYIRSTIAQSLGCYIKRNGWDLVVKMSNSSLWETRETAAYIIGHEAKVWNTQTRHLLCSLMTDQHLRVRNAADYSMKIILSHETGIIS